VEVMKINGQLKEKNIELNEKLKGVDAYKSELRYYLLTVTNNVIKLDRSK